MKKYSALLSAMVTGGVVAYVLFSVNWTQLLRIFDTVRLGMVVLAFSFFLMNTFFRAVRFQILASVEIAPIGTLLGITGLHTAFNYLLPVKTGELAFPVLLRRYLGATLADGASSLFIARLADLLVVSLWILIALFSQASSVEGTGRAALWVFGLAVAGILVFVFLVRKEGSGRKLANLDHIPVIGFVRGFLGRVREQVQKKHKRRILLPVLFLTMAIWFCVYSNFYCLLLSVGVKAAFFKAVMILLLMIPLSILPVQGFANVGGHEVAWVASLMFMGLAYDRALDIAVITHGILGLFVLVVGCIGFGIVWIRRGLGGASG